MRVVRVVLARQREWFEQGPQHLKPLPMVEVADMLGRYRDEVGVEHFVLFFDMPGLTREQMDEQLEMTATEVLPRLVITLGV